MTHHNKYQRKLNQNTVGFVQDCSNSSALAALHLTVDTIISIVKTHLNVSAANVSHCVQPSVGYGSRKGICSMFAVSLSDSCYLSDHHKALRYFPHNSVPEYIH